VIAEVVSTPATLDPYDPEQTPVVFRLRKRLKEAEFWSPGEVKESRVPIYMTTTPNVTGKTLIFPGNEVILAFNFRPRGLAGDKVDPYIDLEGCGVIPLTQDHISQVQRGASQDIFPETRNIWP
jgi:hypothetical protein